MAGADTFIKFEFIRQISQHVKNFKTEIDDSSVRLLHQSECSRD